jgi:hypothetical protein
MLYSRSVRVERICRAQANGENFHCKVMEKNDAKCKGMQTNCKIVKRDCRMEGDGNRL